MLSQSSQKAGHIKKSWYIVSVELLTLNGFHPSFLLLIFHTSWLGEKSVPVSETCFHRSTANLDASLVLQHNTNIHKRTWQSLCVYKQAHKHVCTCYKYMNCAHDSGYLPHSSLNDKIYDTLWALASVKKKEDKCSIITPCVNFHELIKEECSTGCIIRVSTEGRFLAFHQLQQSRFQFWSNARNLHKMYTPIAQ